MDFGVKAILLFHLQRALFFIVVPTMTLVFGATSLSYTGSIAAQTAMAAFSLAGIPLILGGLWAVYNKEEAPLRLYFYYMLLEAFADIGLMAAHFILHGPCEDMPSILKGNGQAFACGASRGANGIEIISLLAIELYMMFIIFSHCEDLRLSSGGPDLSDLAAYDKDIKSHRWKRRWWWQENQHLDPYRRSLEENMLNGYGTVYDEATCPSIGGSTSLFGNHYHETEYPPRR